MDWSDRGDQPSAAGMGARVEPPGDVPMGAHVGGRSPLPVAALPPDRAADFVAALGDRLAVRMCDMEIDECTDEAMLSDIAPVFAALCHRPIDAQEA